MVGGKDHLIKGQNYVHALQKWIEKNPDSSDINVAQYILNDLTNALDGK